MRISGQILSNLFERCWFISVMICDAVEPIRYLTNSVYFIYLNTTVMWKVDYADCIKRWKVVIFWRKLIVIFIEKHIFFRLIV